VGQGTRPGAPTAGGPALGGASMTRSAKPALVSVITDGRYLGCLLSRGVQGTEAFDSCERSLGVFETADAAAAAVVVAQGSTA